MNVQQSTDIVRRDADLALNFYKMYLLTNKMTASQNTLQTKCRF